MPLKILTIAVLLSLSTSAFAASDFMAKEDVAINSPSSKQIFLAMISDLKGVMENVTPKIGGGFSIVAPYRVKGSQARPIVTMTVQKCVTIICQSVDFDTEFVADRVQGNCDLNYEVTGDFSRSGQTLTNIYSKMAMSLCFNADKSGAGVVNIEAHIIRSSSYSTGYIQGQIFGFSKMQVPTMVRAVRKSVKQEIARQH